MADAVTKAAGELADVPPERAFWVHDSGVLKNLEDLCEALDTMSEDTFAYHHNPEKKDFSNWVRDVIGDQRLARDLEKAKSRAAAARTVARRVAALKK